MNATLSQPDLTPSPFETIKPARTCRWSVPYTYGSGVLVLTLTDRKGRETETPYLVARVEDDQTGQLRGWRLTHTLSGRVYFVEADGSGSPAWCDCPAATFRRGAGPCKHALALRAALAA